MAKHFHSCCCYNCYITMPLTETEVIYIHHNDNIHVEKYGLLTRANPIFSDAQTPVDDRCEARCRNKLRCLSRVCKFFHCATNTLIFSGFEAKNVKASGAPPQAPMGELTALSHTPLLVSRCAPPPATPPTNRPPIAPFLDPPLLSSLGSAGFYVKTRPSSWSALCFWRWSLPNASPVCCCVAFGVSSGGN